MILLVDIDCKIDSGRLAVDHTTDTLIIWGKENAYHAGCVYDIENNKQILSFRNEIYSSTCNSTPYFMSKNELIVLNSLKGSFDLYDLTSGRHLENISLPGMILII